MLRLRSVATAALVLLLVAGVTGVGAEAVSMEELRGRAREAPQLLFQEALQAYKDGRFRDATARLGALSGLHASPVIEYDLGNAYFRAGDLGRAVLHWHRALELDPGAEDVLHNLEVATGSPPHGEGLEGLLVKAYAGFTVEALERAALLFLALAVAAFGAGRWGGRRAGLPAALVFALVATATFGWAYARIHHLVRGSRAVVLGAAPSVATAGPGGEGDYPRVFDVHPGQVVVVHRSSGRHVQISLPTGAAGWIPKEALEKI